MYVLKHAPSLIIFVLSLSPAHIPSLYPQESLSDSLLCELQNGSVTTAFALRYLKQTAQGMHYIHSKGFLHCNLSVASLFLDSYGTVKIADFSRARREATVEEDADYVCVLSNELKSDFSVRWMAPEVITDQKWSKASDVWYVLINSVTVCAFTNNTSSPMHVHSQTYVSIVTAAVCMYKCN